MTAASGVAPEATPDSLSELGLRAWLSPRRRFRQWWRLRLRPTDTQVLTQRNVYIVPTGAGLMWGLTIVVLLIASINYSLSLGYALTFLLAGSALAGMHVCHGTLRGLHLHLLPPEPQFAGQPATLAVRLTNERAAPRQAIGLSLLEQPHWVWTDVPGQSSVVVEVACDCPQRGWLTLDALTAETRFPLGSFRVWTVWRPASRVLVYPAPEVPCPPWPVSTTVDGPPQVSAPATQGEFDGVRPYRRGDALPQLAWRKSASALATGVGDLVSRAQAAGAQNDVWLDFAQCGAPDREAALSRLCAWVLLADRLGLRFGLRLPGLTLEPDSGALHRRHCLEALALC